MGTARGMALSQDRLIRFAELGLGATLIGEGIESYLTQIPIPVVGAMGDELVCIGAGFAIAQFVKNKHAQAIAEGIALRGVIKIIEGAI